MWTVVLMIVVSNLIGIMFGRATVFQKKLKQTVQQHKVGMKALWIEIEHLKGAKWATPRQNQVGEVDATDGGI